MIKKLGQDYDEFLKEVKEIPEVRDYLNRGEILDTIYYKNKYSHIECFRELIDNYNLDLRLDDFGMGTEVFHNQELMGEFFVYHDGISFSFTRKYGGNSVVYENWNELCEGIEEKIKLKIK